MKTQEEIEQLADEYTNGKSSSDVFKDAHKNDFIKGYTQCQEDMADKKYTEDDMVLCWNASRDYTIQIREDMRTSNYPNREDYINSLNKQD